MTSQQGPVKAEPSPLLRKNPIIAVLRARDARNYDAVIDVLAENGLRSIELTLRIPRHFRAPPEARHARWSELRDRCTLRRDSAST